MADALAPSLQRTCDALNRSLTSSQMREQRWLLTRQFACQAANQRPTWQQSVDLALSASALPTARVMALTALTQDFGERSVLILLRLVTDRSVPMGVRVYAASLLAAIDAPAGEYALLRAINDNATDQVIALRIEQVRQLNRAGAPNNLRLLLCSEAYDTPRGRRVLEKIWRNPDQNVNAWPPVATLFISDAPSDERLTDAALIAANAAYSPRSRIVALQLLYAFRTLHGPQQSIPVASWTAIRQVWARDGGELKRMAGELLKLQGDRSGR